MKLFLRIFVLVFTVSACNSQKSTIKKTAEEYKKEGYTFGVIEPYASGDCTARITMKELGIQYDPINIQEEKFATFRSKKTEIYFKFLPLRMKNRCDNVSPISLIEVINK